MRLTVEGLTKPRSGTIGSVILALLGSGSVWLWMACAPVYADGPAIATRVAGASELRIIAVLPPDCRSRVRIGGRLLLNDHRSGARIRARIVAVEPGLVHPESFQQRYGLSGTALTISEPSALVIAQAIAGGGFSDGTTVYTARAEIGSRRLIALLFS